MVDEILGKEGQSGSRAAGYHMGDVDTVISVDDVNRQAQTVNINLVFPDSLAAPVTATATIPSIAPVAATR